MPANYLQLTRLIRQVSSCITSIPAEKLQFCNLPTINRHCQFIPNTSAVSRLIMSPFTYPDQYQRHFMNKSQNDSSAKLFIAILTIKSRCVSYHN